MRIYGKVNKVVGLVAHGGLRAPLGAVLPHAARRRKRGNCGAVAGFADNNPLFHALYGDMRGIRPGSLICNTSLPPVFPKAWVRASSGTRPDALWLAA